jgi:outer membrane protein assembly factor BamE
MPAPTLILLLTLLITLLGACAPFSFPYRPDVQQGNIVTQEMIGRLRPGMSQREIRYQLGSPLLIDPFHPDRWDYYYSAKRDGARRKQRRLTLYFKGEYLVHIEGDVYPHPDT